MLGFRTEFLERNGQRGTVNWKIATIFEKAKTLFTPRFRNKDGSRGYPSEVVEARTLEFASLGDFCIDVLTIFDNSQDLADNNAALMVVDFQMPYLYKRSPLLARSKLQITAEYALS